MWQYPQQQQQQQQHHSNGNLHHSNGNLSQPCPQELGTWTEADLDNWLAILPATDEGWDTWFATEPDTSTQQPTTVWTRLQDKAFEDALLTCPEGMENRWERIAALVPGGKTPAQIKERYDQLLHDISLIESGRYVDLTGQLAAAEEIAAATKVDGGTSKHTPALNGNRRECRWTEEEHRLFLVGLQKCGKGDWKGISRRFVVTKDPQQVASHAQKYFLRQSDTEKKRKRKSIHDITIENNDSVPQLYPNPWF